MAKLCRDYILGPTKGHTGSMSAARTGTFWDFHSPRTIGSKQLALRRDAEVCPACSQCLHMTFPVLCYITLVILKCSIVHCTHFQ